MHNYLEKQSDMLTTVTKCAICNIQKDKTQHKCFRRFLASLNSLTADLTKRPEGYMTQQALPELSPVDRMVGSLPIPHGLFAECHSKGGQLSPGCRGGKCCESPFAFQTESWSSTASHLKRRKSRSPLVTKVGCQWAVVEDGCGRIGMHRQMF